VALVSDDLLRPALELDLDAVDELFDGLRLHFYFGAGLRLLQSDLFLLEQLLPLI